MKLTFLGANETVTGSKTLVDWPGGRLLVDCGLYQGRKELRLLNWSDFPVAPESVKAVLLTHAHIDHSGYIPRFIKVGYDGPVYCTEATRDLCHILLPDSGFLQEEDAASANRYGYSRHSPALPLYTEQEARAALTAFRPVPLGVTHQLDDGLGFSLHRAGHILGSSMVMLYSAGGGPRILFTGDIGRAHNPVMKPPAIMQDADYIVIESTYGDRLHSQDDPTEEIGRVIRETAARGGTVVVPSFAVGRAQALLYHIYVLKDEGRIPNLPVYLDSPMAIDATALMQKHMNEHRLSPEECAAVCRVATYTHTAAESKAINASNGMPKVIISASGMATGGRILHHLKHYLGDVRNTILLPGFQAEGTRGDRLRRGEKELRIHGQEWPVRAQIVTIDNMSAHADYGEILSWLGHFRTPPKNVFIVHGETAAAHGLKEKIEAMPGWRASVPITGQQERLI